MWLTRSGVIFCVTGPRGAVGGCSTPGSRVDPWWSPGPFFPPGPGRVDEGPRSSSSATSIVNYGSPAPTSATTPSSPAPSYSPSGSTPCSHHAGIVVSTCSTSRSVVSPLDVGPTSTLGCLRQQNDSDQQRDTNVAVISSGYHHVSAAAATQSNVLSALLANTSTASDVNVQHHQQQQQTASSSQSRNAISTTQSNILCSLLASTGVQDHFAGGNTGPEPTSPDSLHGILSSLNVRIKSEEAPDTGPGPGHRSSSDGPCPSVRDFNTSLLSSLLSTSRVSTSSTNADGTSTVASIKSEYNSNLSNERTNCSSGGVKVEYCCDVLEDPDENLAATSPYNVITTSQNRHGNRSRSSNLQTSVLSKEDLRRILQSAGSTRCDESSPSTSDLIAEMKYETQQPGPGGAPPHLNGPNSGVEQSHHPGQGNNIGVGGSPAEVVGVDSLLLSPWGNAGTDFLESADVKHTAAGFQDALDTYLLGTAVGVTSQSLAELKPLPPFTGYTGHLSINGISGHHFHAIAQRPEGPSSSPTPSSNQEYYESPVVSSSTPCPQGSTKQLPQSTQQEDYDIEDIAAIIGSAIADTTVPGGGNGPGSENDLDYRIDLDYSSWIEAACSPKAQQQQPQQQDNNTSSSPFSQIYGNHNNTSNQSQNTQHGLLHSILTAANYAPPVQGRLQPNSNSLQSPSCGETPSSTSPYPPLSPPERVSTSCSPDHPLHPTFAAPPGPRKRPRAPSGGQNASKKNPSTTTGLPYGTESGLIGGKEKPVHRCSICNRGFLNKSNIKVHLRTHTGEKPFRCEVCGKAFRQKAHLIKHQQIHKRIGRD